jgi:hypothetical protein
MLFSKLQLRIMVVALLGAIIGHFIAVPNGEQPGTSEAGLTAFSMNHGVGIPAPFDRQPNKQLDFSGNTSSPPSVVGLQTYRTR